MREKTVRQSDLRGMTWDADCFKWCRFEKLVVEGEIVTSDFIDCTFEQVDWYWGIFAQVNFIQCSFVHCTFRGTSFVQARFVECKLEDCIFTKDNLNSDCDFSDAKAYGCLVDGGSGFSCRQIS